MRTHRLPPRDLAGPLLITTTIHITSQHHNTTLQNHARKERFYPPKGALTALVALAAFMVTFMVKGAAGACCLSDTTW